MSTQVPLIVNTLVYAKVASPYNKILGDAIIQFTLVSSSLIKDIKSYNVYEVAYKPFDISVDDFNTARDNDVLIYTLKDCKGVLHYIPSDSIDFVDDTTLTPYVMKTILAPISYQPVSESHTDLVNEVKDLLIARTGVNSSVRVVNTSNVIGLTDEMILQLESQRSNINVSSLYAELQQLQDTNAELEAKNAALESKILAILTDITGDC